MIKLKPADYYRCNNIWDVQRQPNAQKWYEELVCGNRMVFVYVQGGEFLGEGALVFENGDPDYTIKNQRVYLSRMIVKPEYRNMGIGGIIIDYLSAYAKELGYCEISLGVDLDNAIAIHLYRKKGFTEVIQECEDEFGKYFKLLKKL